MVFVNGRVFDCKDGVAVVVKGGSCFNALGCERLELTQLFHVQPKLVEQRLCKVEFGGGERAKQWWGAPVAVTSGRSDSW